MTIDFHNTLFHCDAWFHLEIADLPVAFLRWHAEQHDGPLDSGLEHAARTRYRQLRQEVMSSGRECDAVSSVRNVLADLDLTSGGEDVEAGVREIMSSALEDARPLEGAVELTQRLHQAGFALAVISSAAYHPFLDWCLARYDMRDTFSAIVTSASCGIYKSDPAIYRHTLNLLGTDPAEAVHIGDSHRFDVTSASRVGMRTIYLTEKNPGDLVPEPDAVIHHLGEADAHLVRLLPGYSTI